MSSTILIVEPKKLLAEALCKALSPSDYLVNVATSAQTAIASADDDLPDLVILEIELARHNGIEFLYELRSYADWLDVPVIVYSHVSPSRFKLTGKELGALGVKRYFDKSKTSLAELIATVDSELADAPVSH